MNDQKELNRDPQINAGAQRKKRKRKQEMLLRVNRVAMLAVGAAIVLLGLVMLILPLFHVRTVEVVFGSETHYYTEEQIIQAAGIRTGEGADELFAVDLNDVIRKIKAECPYVGRVTVQSVFPSKIRITVTEKANIMTSAYGNGSITFDRTFTVLEQQNGENTVSPFLHITLPQIASAQKGAKIIFAGEGSDTGYILAFLDTLTELGLYPYVTAADVSQRYALSVVLKGKCRVELGRQEDLARKLNLAGEILSEKGGIDARCAVIDVSDPQKPTYRAVEETEL